MLHLWSLAVEEQFYLLWPLMAVIAWRASPRRLILVICGIIAVSLTIGLLEIQKGRGKRRVLPSVGPVLGDSLGRAPARDHARREDAAGSGILEIDSRAHDLIAIAGAALLLTSLAVRSGRRVAWMACSFPRHRNAVAAHQSSRRINQRVLSLRPLVAIGLISYPLYLSHWLS